jgi:hypothetical protein
LFSRPVVGVVATYVIPDADLPRQITVPVPGTRGKGKKVIVAAERAGVKSGRGKNRTGEPATAHSTVLRTDAAMGQDGHACMASAETSRNSFSVAPLAD